MSQIPQIPIPIKPENKFSALRVLQYIVLISVILYFGKPLFIPLSFSFLISIALYPICTWLEKKGIPKGLSIGMAISSLFILLTGIVFLLFLQLKSFLDEWDTIKNKSAESLIVLNNYLETVFNFSKTQQESWINQIKNEFGKNIFPFVGDTIYSLGISLVFAVLIPIFSALILYHRKLFVKVLYSLFKTEHTKMIHEILHETVHSFYSFIKGMLLVYLIVAVLNSIGLAIVGVPHPILFGFIASVLTFIPYVGIIIASLLPIAISWITYNSIWYPLGVILVFTIVQYLEANVIFPFTVSQRLNLNTFVTIVAILAGGILWGASGMILFIPFLGILKLIADKSKSMNTIALFLGNSKTK
ncbi:MAG: AI-2E family transporter [Bacteroidetes bacterium]|nr:MAG: AI-2E family transporter [Bacteroidota bacterium]